MRERLHKVLGEVGSELWFQWQQIATIGLQWEKSCLTFLLGSSSFIQVMRTVIRSRMSSKFGWIRPWTAELAALERLKKSPLTYNMNDVVNTPAFSFLIRFSSFLQVTLCYSSAFIFIRIFFILGSYKDIHNISDEFEFRPDRTSDCRVICP